MDKKKQSKNADQGDLRGFEEFIESQSQETSFLPRGVGGSTKKNDGGFEHFTFLTNDAERLSKLNSLLSEKLPFAGKYDQASKLLLEQREELSELRKKLFELQDKEDSPYRKSLAEVFNAIFVPRNS